MKKSKNLCSEANIENGGEENVCDLLVITINIRLMDGIMISMANFAAFVCARPSTPWSDTDPPS